MLPTIVLLALLAGPEPVPGSLSGAGEQATSAAHDDGMAAMPTRAASAILAIASAGVPTPAVSATHRVVVSLHRFVCASISNGAFHLSPAVKPAPTVLRL